MGVSFLVDLVHRSPRAKARGCGELNRPENLHPLALSVLDPVEHAQDHFHYGYHFVNSDFRPCWCC